MRYVAFGATFILIQGLALMVSTILEKSGWGPPLSLLVCLIGGIVSIIAINWAFPKRKESEE